MKKILLVILFLFMSICAPVSAAGWEAIPKLKLHVTNAPEEPFYLDLLINDGQVMLFNTIYRNQYDASMWDTLRDTQTKEEHFGMIDGTYLRMTGDLVGKKQEDGSLLFEYDGKGVPTEFNIVSVDKDFNIKKSNIAYRTVYYDEIYYDYASNTISYREHHMVFIYQYLFFAFIFISAKLLGYKLLKLNKTKKEFIYSLVTTFIVTLITSPMMTMAMLYNGNLMQAALIMMLVTIVSIFIDMLIYNRFYKKDILVATLVPLVVNVIVVMIVVNLLQYEFVMMLW